MAERAPRKPAAKNRTDYRHLPEQIRLEDTIAEQETRPVPDPDGDLNPDQLFLLRYGAG
ncbi:MAG: hypothetical protein ACJ72O_13075 [Marmoricola sp.]